LEGSFLSFFHQANNEKIKPVYAVFGEFADAQFDNMVSRCKTLQGFVIEFEQKNAAAPSIAP
nr:hypothetical protein [Gammaproteobacteria bacterium]